MAFQLLLASSIIIIMMMMLLHLFNLVYLAEASSMALPDCRDRWGEISIPYPFGMKHGCYLEESFKINCSSNGTPTLLSGLEVLQISVEDGTVGVMSGVFSLCADASSTSYSSPDAIVINLASTPFSFSSASNSFTAVGCHNLALLKQTDVSAGGGCVSICEKDKTLSTVDGRCTGINCCQATIPSSLKVLDMSIYEFVFNTSKPDSSDNCKYAFLVNQNWFDEEVSIRNGNVSEIAKMGYVPVELDWVVPYNTYGLILNKRLDELSSYDQSASCIDANSTDYNGSVVRCSCSQGAEGNPYVPNGCTCNDTNSAHCMYKDGRYVCSGIIDPDKKKIPLLLAIMVGFGVLIVATGIWALCKVWRKRRSRKRREKNFKRNGGLLLQEQLLSGEVNVERVKMFSFKELDKATDHFNVNRMLGQGGQGTVYKGMLADGRIVAVKRSKESLDECKTQEFINEVVILSQINHRNVVKLLGCCLETEVPLLVYEFIPNGNLFELLQGHENDEDVQLTWDMRLKIGVEVSGSLAYLHSAASMPIYHRDIKSTNILLDEKYRAKVADFGISKSVTIDQTHVTTRVQGTLGYLDPEYFRSSQFTDKSDVYSFGVVLVELLTGLKPISSAGKQEVRSLVYRFLLCMEEDRLFDIVDNRIEATGRRDEIVSVANLARRCLNWTGKERPSMKEVAVVLEGIQKTHQVPDASPAHAQQPALMESDHWDFGFTSTNQYSSLDSTDIDSLVVQRVSSFSIN